MHASVGVAHRKRIAIPQTASQVADMQKWLHRLHEKAVARDVSSRENDGIPPRMTCIVVALVPLQLRTRSARLRVRVG